MTRPLADLAHATPWRIAKRERDPRDFLPYARHADSNTIVGDNGILLSVLRVEGIAHETVDMRDRNTQHEQLNLALRNLADPRMRLWATTIRRRDDGYPDGQFTSAFARSLDDAYRQRVARERGFVNELYLTVIMLPAAGATDRVIKNLGDMFRRGADRAEAYSRVSASVLQLFNERIGEVMQILGRLEPRRLGLYDHRGLQFSEPLEFFERIMMGRGRRVPLVRGHLGSALYGERVIFGREAGEVRAHDRSHYFGLFGIREYPAETRPNQLDHLLSTPFPYVMTQSWAPAPRAQAAERIRTRRRQLASTDDDALSQAEALDEAADGLASNDFVMGDHHFSLMVMGDSIAQLNDHMGQARALLSDAGLVAARETSAIEAAFWAQLPGNAAWRARPAVITSRNFAALSPFHNHPSGQASGNAWGPAVAVLQTSALTPYYFNFHVRDVAFCELYGPTGSGKTVVLNFLMAMMEKFGARQIFIDKDRGAEIYVRASGGVYLALRNGQPTGFAPLKSADYGVAYRAFLGRFVRQLVTIDGKPLTASEEKLIDQGIASLARLPQAQRSLSELREILGYRDVEGIGARLERWTQSGALGWVFDNEVDEIRLDRRFVGLDMTDFLDNAEIRTPVMMYLFERIDGLLARRDRLVVVIDEFWKALGDDQFTSYVENALLTWRKLNAFLVFATQNPEHALRSRIASSIRSQAQTTILLPNDRADERQYREGLGLTAQEFDLVRTLEPHSHRFLIKQGRNSVVVKLDLSGMDDALAVLSGRASTVALVDELRAAVGDDPDRWLPLFHEQRRGLQ